MENSSNIRYLIVGAGISGLTLALHLNQRGSKQVQVVEVENSYSANKDYIISLCPNGSRILKGFGLYEQALALCGTGGTSTHSIHSDYGRSLAEINFEESRDIYGPIINVSHMDMLNLLANECKRRNIALSYGVTIQSISQSDQNVIVKYSTEDQNVEGEYDLLIGADGFNSRIREEFYPKTSVTTRDAGYSGWTFNIPRSDLLPASANLAFWGKGNFLVKSLCLLAEILCNFTR